MVFKVVIILLPCFHVCRKDGKETEIVNFRNVNKFGKKKKPFKVFLQRNLSLNETKYILSEKNLF